VLGVWKLTEWRWLLYYIVIGVKFARNIVA
jgi:hypothetical protein